MPTLYVLLAGILWSFSGILIKEIHCHAFTTAGIRSLIGLAIQFAFLVYIKNKKDKVTLLQTGKDVLKRVVHLDKLHWLGAIFLFLNIISLVFAFQITFAADAVFLHYSGLVLISLLSWPILQQKLSKKDWLSVLLAMTGIGFLAYNGIESNNIYGSILGIFCGLTLAIGQICLGLRSKLNKSGLEPLETIVLANIIVVLVSLVAVPFYQSSLPSNHDWILLVILGIIPWAIPDTLYAIGIKYIPIFRAMIIGLLDPILTALWPWIFLGESPTKLALIGACFITFAIISEAKSTS